MSHFSEKLIQLRKTRGLSQQQLAEALGLSRSAIGMYETGKREPDMDVLQLLSDYFMVDMNTLVSPPSGETNELTELLETLRSREDMRMLFKLARDATPEDVQKAVEIIEGLYNA